MELSIPRYLHFTVADFIYCLWLSFGVTVGGWKFSNFSTELVIFAILFFITKDMFV